MKIRKMALISFLLFSTIIFYSCGECSKKIDCPGFADTTLTRLFSYADNQQMIFRTTGNEQAVFTLKNTETTQPYQATGGALSPVYCDAQKIFASVEKDTANTSSFTVTLRGDSNNRSADITIHKNYLSFYTITPAGFSIVSINGYTSLAVLSPLITIGNRTFTDIITAARDTAAAKTAGIYKIYYTKTEGLVGYSEYPSLKTWVKQ